MANSSTHMATLKNMGYTFKLNVLDDSIEVNGEKITDILRLKIRTELRDLGYNRDLTAIEEAWSTEALAKSYNPLKEYFENLPPYNLINGEIWVIPKLCSYFQDIDNIFQIWLTKFLIGAIAKVYHAGTHEPVQNPMLVMVGTQNLGKSRFAKWLTNGCSRYFIEAYIDTKDKDTWLRLIRHLIWEVGELEGVISREDRAALKDFITKDKVSVRKAYGKNDIEKPAVCSLIGTVNENGTGFLNDSTGSRRFLACELTAIDWEYSKIDPDMLWAEAYYLFQQNPESYLLTAKEVKTRNVINSKFQMDDPVEDMIKKYFEITDDPADFIPSVNIREKLELHGLRGSERQNAMKIAEALKKLNVLKGHDTTGKIRGFKGIVIL
jgi:predicted P-loop ATPase